MQKKTAYGYWAYTTQPFPFSPYGFVSTREKQTESLHLILYNKVNCLNVSFCIKTRAVLASCYCNDC